MSIFSRSFWNSNANNGAGAAQSQIGAPISGVGANINSNILPQAGAMQNLGNTSNQMTISAGQATLTVSNHTHTHGGMIVHNGLTWTTSGFNMLTPAEQQELQDLRKNQETESKQIKLSEFKKLPQSMRETVITLFNWNSAVQDMNNMVAPKSPRIMELEQREHHGNIHMYTGTHFTQGYGGFMIAPGLPNGISIEDLKQAHLDAVMEEEVLGEDIT